MASAAIFALRMSILEKILASSMKFGFVNADLMPGTESIIYVPRTGSSRTIKAQVFRDPVHLDPSVPRPKMRIIVANDSTIGISSSELDTGGDQIEVAYRIGQTAQRYNINRSPGAGEDPAALYLEL